MSCHPSYSGAKCEAADFEAVVEQFYAPLFRFAMSLTRTEPDACDLVQDTFVKWAEKGGQLRDHTKIKGWLFTTLHRKFLERERKLARFPHLEISEVEAELKNIEPPCANHLDASAVLSALNQLDPAYRAAVALFYLEQCSHAEIAAILEVPVGTVKSRISRGVAQLKERLGSKEHGGQGMEAPA